MTFCFDNDIKVEWGHIFIWVSRDENFMDFVLISSRQTTVFPDN